VKLLPGPAVHPDIAAFVALAVLCRGGRNAESRVLVSVLVLLVVI
jgi:hypothetical protein